MTVRFRTMEKVVGAFVLLTLLVVLAGLAMVGQGRNWFRKHHSFYLDLDQGYDLESGSDVKLLGALIGEVAELQLTRENRVRVKLRILAQHAWRLRSDSRARVKLPLVLGSSFVTITPGGKEAPPIPPGGEIPVVTEQSLEELVQKADLQGKLAKLGEAIDELAKLAKGLNDPQGPLQGTLAGVQRLTQSVEKGQGTLGRLVSSEDMYKGLEQKLDQVGAILASLKKTVDNAAALTPTAKTITNNLEKTTGKMPAITIRAEDVLARMERVLGLLEKTMKELPELTRQGGDTLGEVKRVLKAVQENFLIKSNLPSKPKAKSHGSEVRGD